MRIIKENSEIQTILIKRNGTYNLSNVWKTICN